MAKVGFEYIKAAKLDETVSKSAETAKYTDAKEIGPGANFSGSPTTSDVKDYGDDRTLETDTSVTGGTISAELNEPTLETEAWLLGHNYDETNDEVIRNANDLAPLVGVGLVGKSRRNGTNIFRAKVYLKVQFKEPNDENATRQENTTFTHTTLEGNIFTLENGDWKKESEFTTLAEAKAYIDGFFTSAGTGV